MTGRWGDKANAAKGHFMHRRRAIRLTVLALLLLVTSGVATAQFSASSPSSLSEAAQSSLVTVTAYDASGKVIATGGGCFVRDNVVATDYLTIKDAASIKISTSRAEGITGWLFAVDRSRLLALIHPDGTKAPPLLPSDDSGSAGASGGALAVTGIRDGLADLTTVSVALSTDKDSNQFLKVDSGGQELLAGSPVIDSTGRIAGIVTTVAGAHTGCFCAVPAVVLSDLIFQTVNDVASRNDHTASARHFEVVPDVPAGKDSNNVPTGATQTKTIRCVEPVYPALAKAAGIYGSVIVGITIDEDGYVIAVHAIRGDPWLRGAAAGAAMGWKFVPTKLNGVPVKVIGNITFTFSSPDNNRSNQQNAQDSPDVLKHLEAVKTDPRS
ncbi:MAG TPA: energy transducer TonB, partial [Blastocatellia bacterium]|nr:energy transducer TonB [Blastocatellia bacterium]